ncbi:hypothetical protein [Poseidonocella sp. HB161398]|uniref:hypothetical protein n=1 Tax=Poseidonocella sp. HB161398 TaxID=2320855 RepID=UPI00110878BF|nr:hypothetical protein [Poseidonocella sp. HB161398]
MSRTVWGFRVARSKGGRNIWRPELKREAARRMLEENRPPAELAREIGANDFLVREWLNEERLRRASARRPAGGFAEVIVEDAGAAAPDVLREAEAARRRAASICISFGDVRMEVPADLDEGTLSKFIRALRAA